MDTPREIIDFIGREAVAERVGVSLDRVTRARKDAHMPASWMHALEQMAGRPLPRSAFYFKGVE